MTKLHAVSGGSHRGEIGILAKEDRGPVSVRQRSRGERPSAEGDSKAA
jgi:hypothetical protein